MPTYIHPATMQTYSTSGSNAGSGVHRVLAAAVASFTLTAAAVGLNFGFATDAEQASFTFAGQQVGISRSVVAAQASFSVTFEAADSILASRRLTATQQTYTLTGSQVYFLGDETMNATYGGFSFTGNGAGIYHDKGISGESGSIEVDGGTVGFDFTMAATYATYTLSGQAASLEYGHSIVAGPGVFTLTGRTVAFSIDTGSCSPTIAKATYVTLPTTRKSCNPPWTGLYDNWTGDADPSNDMVLWDWAAGFGSGDDSIIADQNDMDLVIIVAGGEV